MLFGKSRTGRLARQNNNQTLVPAHHPFREQDRLGLKWVAAGDQNHVGFRPVVIRGAEHHQAGIVRSCRVVSRPRLVVGCVRRRLDRFKRQLGNGVGVFEVLIGVSLHPPGSGAVSRNDVPADLRHDVDGQVPGDRDQLAADSHQRIVKSIPGGAIGIVYLLCNTPSADRVITVVTDNRGLMIRMHDHMMLLPVDQTIVVLVGRDPLAGQLLDGKLDAQCVFIFVRPTCHSIGPHIRLLAAADDAVVAHRGDDFGIGWRQRNLARRRRIDIAIAPFHHAPLSADAVGLAW